MAVLAAALLAGVSASGASAAATVKVDGKCFASWTAQKFRNEIPLEIMGLPAGATVRADITAGGKTLGSTSGLTVDSTGNLLTSITNWSYGGVSAKAVKSKRAKISVVDAINGTVLGTANTKVTKVGLTIDKGKKSVSTPRKWTISGLALVGSGPAKSYHAHYFNADGSKQVGKQKLGKIKDACGYMTTSKRLAPPTKAAELQVRIQAAPSYLTDASWTGRQLFFG